MAIRLFRWLEKNLISRIKKNWSSGGGPLSSPITMKVQSLTFFVSHVGVAINCKQTFNHH
jgi:hypothetical protein